MIPAKHKVALYKKKLYNLYIYRYNEGRTATDSCPLVANDKKNINGTGDNQMIKVSKYKLLHTFSDACGQLHAIVFSISEQHPKDAYLYIYIYYK